MEKPLKNSRNRNTAVYEQILHGLRVRVSDLELEGPRFNSHESTYLLTLWKILETWENQLLLILQVA